MEIEDGYATEMPNGFMAGLHSVEIYYRGGCFEEVGSSYDPSSSPITTIVSAEGGCIRQMMRPASPTRNWVPTSPALCLSPAVLFRDAFPSRHPSSSSVPERIPSYLQSIRRCCIDDTDRQHAAPNTYAEEAEKRRRTSEGDSRVRSLQEPCQFCIRAKARCTFDASYTRGRKFGLPSGYDDSPRAYSALLPSPETSQTNSSVPELPLQSHEHVSAGVSSRNSPEPSQTDLQGHYIGPASGVSFLLRVQKRLHQAISFAQPSSIFTFGDAPLHLPEFDPSFCMMLPRADAHRLVDRYFDFAMPTYRFLHRPTIEEWFAEFYDTLGVMRDAHSAPAKVALLFMVFSQARVYMPDNDRPGPPDLSARYYLAAEHQLSKEKGSIRLTSVQARLTQCYYLLTQSRINHCWSLFGTVSHLALAIGLNRNRRPDPAAGISHIEAECRRRTFWCAYTLDAYLSAALGRPRSFHDDDIDTELPACVEDHELMAAQINMPMTPASTRNLTTMLAPLAHMKIARIISRILRDLYSIKPVSESRRASAVKTISKELNDWRSELAWFLDADVLSAALIMPIFQRQRNVLNLTFWHSIILTHRPFVLSNFARLSQQGSHRAQTEESVKQCLNAAMKTVRIIDEITQNRQLFRALW
ncbi:fungal-specific transcription factor domain-containing protein, partial [Aspergillus pseudoustus]